MSDVLKEFTINYNKISKLKSVFSDLSRADGELDDEQKNIVKKITKKSDCVVDGRLKEELVEIFELMGVMYDEDEECFYDLANPIKVHQVNILPEKYFRSNPIEEISTEALSKEIAKIKREMTKLFKDVMKW